MTTRIACQYSVIRFQPFMETGEFANVGVALVCPSMGVFVYKLQTRKFARITHFFHELNRSVYLDAIQATDEQLKLAQQHHFKGARPDQQRLMFEVLTRPRQAIIQFDKPRALLTQKSPGQALNTLFDHYVDHAFVTPEYVESRIAQHVAQLLSAMDLPRPFRPARLGDELVHANIPFVQADASGYPLKGIKPFNLAQSEANKILEHGDVWTSKITRLQKQKALPPRLLFAIATPSSDDTPRHQASLEIQTELRRLGVTTVDERDDIAIKAFARAH